MEAAEPAASNTCLGNMKSAVQYLTNEAGERTSVIVSYAAWEKLRLDQQRLRHKLQIMQGIRARI